MSSGVPKIFFTADIAAVLNVPEWRILKFAQGREYQITPSQNAAEGSGSRRVYDIENVCEMALALRLLDAGLGARAIGEILDRLKNKEKVRLSSKLELSDSNLAGLYLAVFRSPRKGKYFFSSRGRDVFFVSDLGEANVEQSERPGHDLLLVSVGATFQKLVKRLKNFQKNREKKNGAV
jgi:hypothetical protein